MKALHIVLALAVLLSTPAWSAEKKVTTQQSSATTVVKKPPTVQVKHVLKREKPVQKIKVPEKELLAIAVASSATIATEEVAVVTKQPQQEIQILQSLALPDPLAIIISMSGYPERLLERLPSIKTVYPTGEKPMTVINLKCPVEVIIGETMTAPNAVRSGLNGLFDKLDETNIFPVRMQFVCS